MDIDECKTNTHKCTRYSTCSNTFGSYECRCDEGYTGDGLSQCYDLNECEAKTHECAPERSLVNNLDKPTKLIAIPCLRKSGGSV